MDNRNVDKMYYKCKKEFKLFGIKIAESTDITTIYMGKGEFIYESIPNQEYFEQEYRINKDE